MYTSNTTGIEADVRGASRPLRGFARSMFDALTKSTTGSNGYWSQLASIALPVGGWVYRDAHYLVADIELDIEHARRFVPRPLRLAEPPAPDSAGATSRWFHRTRAARQVGRARVFTGWFPTNTFGSVYREAGVFFDVVHRGVRAMYCPWMLVDDDVALIAGRELLGYPKKLGELTWERDGNRIRGTAARRGAPLIEMAGTLGEQIEAPPMLGRPHRNIRTSAGLAIPKVIAFTPRERAVEVRRADLEVTITGSERDPLHEMGFGRVLDARLHRVDLGGQLPRPIGLASPLGVIRQLLTRSH